MSAHELFNRANEEWEAGRRQRAFKLFLRAAAEGDAFAYNSIGYLYDHGIGVAKNAGKAFLWYRKGARRGDVCACNNLAITYRAAGNIRRARFWFAKALAEGDGDAALELAKLALSRKRPNVEQALRYLTIAARSRYILDDSKDEARKLLRVLKSGKRAQLREK